MNRKVQQIEILRAVATIWVLIYHVWVYSQYPDIGYNYLVAYGGEIGVTMFFIISGFAIFMSIDSTIEKSGKIVFKDFIIKRIMKVIPAYYISIFILAFFSQNGYINSLNGVKDMFFHITFTHNLFMSTHGSINGVFWTLGVTVQFYILSIFLYRIIKKYKVRSIPIFILIVIAYKYVVFNYIFKVSGESIQYFIYGRQLLGSLDNFMIGMGIAWLYKNKFKLKDSGVVSQKNIVLISSICVFMLLIFSLNKNILYSNTWLGYTWHSALAVTLGMFIICILQVEINEKSSVNRCLLYISNIEYSIYIWHLPILIKLCNESFINNISASDNRFYYLLCITLLISIIWSAIYTRMIHNIIEEIYNKLCISKNKKNILIIFLAMAVLVSAPNYTLYIKNIIYGIKDYVLRDINMHDNLGELVERVNDIVPDTNETTYIFFDDNDYEGTMNFWRIRYYLSPRKTIHWNSYAFNLNTSSEEEVQDYLNSIDVDYVIIRKCPAIDKAFNLDNSKEGYIFQKNKGSKGSIKDILKIVGE